MPVSLLFVSLNIKRDGDTVSKVKSWLAAAFGLQFVLSPSARSTG